MKHFYVVQRHKQHFLEINMFILKLMQIIKIIDKDVKERLWEKKQAQDKVRLLQQTTHKALKQLIFYRL